MNTPLGGNLINRIVDAKTRKALLKQDVPHLTVSNEKIIEAWDIATGAFSPLTGFLGKKDLQSVLKSLCLSSGIFWPIPIILDIDNDDKNRIAHASGIFLTDDKGVTYAHLKITDMYSFPKETFEAAIYKTHDLNHPGVKHIRNAKEFLVGGEISWIAKPYNTIKPAYTPREIRKKFTVKGWKRIVAFHTRNVPHRGHEHVMREGLNKTDGLLVQPLIGRKKKGDFRNEVVADAYRCFVKLVLPRGKAILSFLPYSAYFAGPREALLTAVIRKNFGCTHFIVGRDHTGVGDFYTSADYARLIKKYKNAMGIEILHFGNAFYCTHCKANAFDETCPHEERYRIHPSGTIIRKMLVEGKIPPEEMMRPEIAKLLLKEELLFV
jgi:sulfate adenylyltransferase